jgi:hypothetical protein
MSVIKLEMDTRMLERIEAQDELGLTSRRKEDGETPRQDVHVELWMLLGNFREESLQRRLRMSQRLAKQTNAAIEIPA